MEVKIKVFKDIILLIKYLQELIVSLGFLD